MGAAKGSGAIGTTPLSAVLDLDISCSATDWPAELDGGPGGSDAPEDFREGSDAESAAWVSTLIFTWWEIICRSKLARSREMHRLARSHEMRRLAWFRERRAWRR